MHNLESYIIKMLKKAIEPIFVMYLLFYLAFEPLFNNYQLSYNNWSLSIFSDSYLPLSPCSYFWPPPYGIDGFVTKVSNIFPLTRTQIKSQTKKKVCKILKCKLIQRGREKSNEVLSTSS